MSLADLQNVVSELSEPERGKLAAWLLDSLPPHSQEDAAADSLQEARRRREELDAGTDRPLTADEFWDAVERDRAEWR